ncbi:MAG: glycosyl transferase family protein [Novosphingobium sp.]|nr:glycosyl transferase family protein [Novosphingobium sp.]
MEWLALVERELLLFAGSFFLLGALDELAVDLVWIWLKLTGRARTGRIDRAAERHRPLAGAVAVLIPTWREAEVIGATVAHALEAWPQAGLRLYVGCYRNDPGTAEAVLHAARGDPRLRLVVHGNLGPTTKADCLNRLYRALEEDERRTGRNFRMVVLHDAEDMVDPAALGVLDRAIAGDEGGADFVQLPVRPEPQPESRWVAGHYCEEFAEAHAKALVVRDALGAGLPAAGVGCAFSRAMLDRLDRLARGAQPAKGGGPFSVESLTEDYELGLRITALGGRSRFLRLRGEDGELVATRACFPPGLGPAVRQKTRWIHGIAFQGWDRLGWSARPVELWMRLRDRRGPLSAIVLAAAYLMLVFGAVLAIAGYLGFGRPWKPDPLVGLLIGAGAASLVLRAGARFGFTAHEYGLAEGLWAMPRIVVANVIAIMAGRRALFAYLATLGGKLPRWDKTDHAAHPALMRVGPSS